MTKIITIAFATLFGLLLVSDLAHADAAATYAAKCKMCHGADGKGNAAMKVAAYNTAKPEADLVKAITGGVSPKMPSYKGKLADAEIAELAKYIKTLK